MSTHKIISVQDIKASAFLFPQTVRTSAEGIRSFQSACQDSNSLFHKHPSDFILFELGTFNELDGSLIPHSKPITLATASDYVQSL